MCDLTPSFIKFVGNFPLLPRYEFSPVFNAFSRTCQLLPWDLACSSRVCRSQWLPGQPPRTATAVWQWRCLCLVQTGASYMFLCFLLPCARECQEITPFQQCLSTLWSSVMSKLQAVVGRKVAQLYPDRLDYISLAPGDKDYCCTWCVSVCEQNHSKTYKRILTKLGKPKLCWPGTTWFDFGESPLRSVVTTFNLPVVCTPTKITRVHRKRRRWGFVFNWGLC